jgi:hypothetical protein
MFGSVLLLGILTSASASAQQEAPPPEPVSVFGWELPDTERLKISGTFIAGWSHDGAQAQLGLEKQGRVAQATIALAGRVTNRIRYVVSFNPVNEVASRPACGEEHFFFPNDPAFYAAGPVVPCDPENGLKRVDTYNTYALDYISQQGPLREGYVDWRASDAVSARLGRFILPIGFAPLDVGSWTAKDLTRIQRLNAEANFGLMLGYTHRDAAGTPLFEANVMGVLGEGNREKDYDWFYFVNTSLDTNSALTAVASVRARPHRLLDVRAAYKRGFTGSKVERLAIGRPNVRTTPSSEASACSRTPGCRCSGNTRGMSGAPPPRRPRCWASTRRPSRNPATTSAARSSCR